MFVLWLVFLLGVLAWVTTRQTASVVLAAQLREIRSDRSAAEAEKSALQRRIREAIGLSVLVPRAESLGLRLPDDSEIIILQVPVPDTR